MLRNTARLQHLLFGYGIPLCVPVFARCCRWYLLVLKPTPGKVCGHEFNDLILFPRQEPMLTSVMGTCFCLGSCQGCGGELCSSLARWLALHASRLPMCRSVCQLVAVPFDVHGARCTAASTVQLSLNRKLMCSCGVLHIVCAHLR